MRDFHESTRSDDVKEFLSRKVNALRTNFKAACFVLALIVLMSSFLTLTSCSNTNETKTSNSPNYLVLVNKDNPISEDFIDNVELCDAKNFKNEDCKVEKKTLQAYKKLEKYLKEKGVEIAIDSPYRSVEEQQQVMDEFTEKYGEDYAKRTVAVPGTSEHHTGLAIDIVPKVNGKWVEENADMIKETEVFKVIHRALPKFGFILRYPKNNKAGYDYEPWHIRFVGEKVAKEIYDRGIIFEEYFQ